MAARLLVTLLLAGVFVHPSARADEISSPAGTVPALMTAFVVAACSTALILALVVRASGKRHAPGRPHAEPDSREIPDTESEEAGRIVAGEEPAPDDDDDGFFGLGRDLRSAREELALALRLHSGPMGEGSRRCARTACSADATTADRVRVAKRLGIGRGEIELALRLQKLESNTPVEGEIA